MAVLVIVVEIIVMVECSVGGCGGGAGNCGGDYSDGVV